MVNLDSTQLIMYTQNKKNSKISRIILVILAITVYACVVLFRRYDNSNIYRAQNDVKSK